MNNETWLPVAGYENLYEVSSLGRVRSLVSGRVMRPAKNRYGYLKVNLYKNGKHKTHTVHRLVATAFLENPLNLPQVNHKNERKDDNRVENLEWCDARYNCTYGSLADRVREVYQYDLDGAPVACYPSVMEAERQTGVNSGAITLCANRKRKTQGGYQWRYEPALFLDHTEGRLNDTHSKRVYQYGTQTGRFVKEWPSAAEVQRQTGWSQGHISECCSGKRYHFHNFRWFYTFQGYKISV